MRKARQFWLGILFSVLISGSIYAATTVKTISLDAYDLVYDPFSGKIYASVSSTDTKYANSIAIINPSSGGIEKGVLIGSDPRALAISSDGEYIYAGLSGEGNVSRFHVQSQTKDKVISLGTGSYGTTYAEDIAVVPGNSKVIAVSRYRKGVSPRHDGVAIYDDGMKRSQVTPDHTGSNCIEFSDNPEILYGYNNETTEFAIRKMIVNNSGVATTVTKPDLFSGFGTDFQYDDGIMYSTNGTAVDCETLSITGSFSGAGGEVEPDHTVRRTFFINGTTLLSYNQTTYQKEGQYTVSGVTGTARNLIRWGSRGLAYSTSDKKVVIIETDLVPAVPTLTNLSIEGPSQVSSYKAGYKLTATFSDGIVSDITNKSRWSVEPNIYTSIDNTGRLNIFGTEQGGSTTIRVKYNWAGTEYAAEKAITYDGVISATGNLVRIEIEGPRQVLQGETVNFKAKAIFDDNRQYDVTGKVIWSLSKDIGNISETGVFTAGQIQGPRDVIVEATFGYKEIEVRANKTIMLMEYSSQRTSSDWAMYQSDAQHTGYVPVTLDPSKFELRWEKQVSSMSLNPVAASNGKVFVSYRYAVEAIDSKDGRTLWSKGFGNVFSVNPPSFAYGNMYIQTCNHSGDTFLHGIEADSGTYIFQSPLDAQWESYAAPTIYDGSVYVNGGYYGGMYGLDSINGDQTWFIGLAQEDGWTPAVEGDHCYAFLEGSLVAVNRYYGTTDFNIKVTSTGTTRVPVKGSYNDILVTDGTALYSVDLIKKNIRWTVAGTYSGMPSVAKGVVYAVNNNKLEAREELTGGLLWSWTSPDGALKSPFVVSSSHVLICSENKTYAIDIESHSTVWTYALSGYLSLGNDSLYIARSNGILTSIAMPEYLPGTITNMEIIGSSEIMENTTNNYQVEVTYSDGQIRNRTGKCKWTAENILTDLGNGDIKAGQVIYLQETELLKAEYEEGGNKFTSEKAVKIKASLSETELVSRNLRKAIESKEKAQDNINSALMYEKASSDILSNLMKENPSQSKKLDRVKKQVDQSMTVERFVELVIFNNIRSLMAALKIMQPTN